ncbi:sigma 54-interacting transcriptional regulator [Desulfomonile tiedjei]|uniref:PAS domain S-box n=1 Tax=Desulfomonile tiedjei (strain ATCC 49306 / DSM 6799 / DCB-1) TaxID=706587 RepID=I4CBL1_DESTA|nr:sigma 54-interacting transcriptional regulator [Desulfomonile tiedjei]AFM26952.1 PAS domain S-box [Desulfomonile tiedjei DSM 6799]
MKTNEELLAEIALIRERLEEAEDTLRAIRAGEVDAIVISGSDTERIYTLEGQDRAYRMMVETMHEGAASLSADGTILYCNTRLAELLGSSLEQIIATPLKLYLVPEERDSFMNLIGESKTERSRREFTFVRSDGSKLHALVSSNTYRQDGIETSCAVIMDISDRKKVEEELQAANERLARILEASSDGFYEWDLIKDRIQRSKAELFGYSPDQTGGVWQDFMARLHPEDRARVQKAFDDHVQGHKPVYDCEYRAKMPSGEWRWIWSRGKVIERDADGNPLRAAGALTDITAKREIEDQRRRTEEVFRAIFEGAQDCIYIKDHLLRYKEVNPAMEQLFQLPAADIIGKTDADLLEPSESGYFNDVDSRVLRGAYIEDEHTRRIHGVPTTLHEIRVPLKDSEGNIIGICGIARNVTERKEQKEVTHSQNEYPSEAMQETITYLRLASKRDATILLLGESGSGKDYFAKFIHQRSPRSSGPFFAVNCAAVAPELAESELFGHERGAFTGAQGRKRGQLELAEGGTLLLNEVGELSLTLQAKLLTFLDTREFTRVGGEKPVSVSARLIAATNKDLKTEVDAGRFRMDLFYRLNVMTITIPPLRERKADIPLLVKRILAQLRFELQLPYEPQLDGTSMEILIDYDWPGNVRELRNVLERSVMLSNSPAVQIIDLGGRSEVLSDWSHTIQFPKSESINDITRNMKSRLVSEALRRSGGSKKGAAKLLGISRYSLKHYLKTLDLGFYGVHDDYEM